MICRFCGKEIVDESIVCFYCKEKVEPFFNNTDNTEEYERIKTEIKPWDFWVFIILIVVSLLVPIAGIVIGLIHQNNESRYNQSIALILLSIAAICILFVNVMNKSI